MAKTLILKRDATCADCGAHLPAGTKARYYGPKHIYGRDCHEDTRTTQPRERHVENGHVFANEGHARSHYDPTGFYTADGTLIGRQNPNGRCEDAPCCGCCS
jgi:transposase